MTSTATSENSPWRPLALLALICLALYLPGISLRDLWAPDEIRYTEVAREMDQAGSLALPLLNNEPYAHKPPLFFWLAILVKQFMPDWGPVPGRLVSALSAMGTVLLTFLMARRLGIGRAAVAAGVVLATAAEFLWLARWGAMDTLLSFFVLLCLYAFLKSREAGSLGWQAVAYLAASMAILAKGPMGVLIPAIAIAITVTRLEGPKALFSRNLLWGIPLMLAPVVLWLALAIFSGGEAYGREVLLDQNVGRLTNEGVGAHHNRAFYYYLTRFPANFLPWILFLPGGLVMLAREKSLTRETKIFLAAYFLGVFLVLSFIPAKREKYLLPIYPAAALIVGYLLTVMTPIREKYERYLKIPGLLLTGISALIGLGFVITGIGGLPLASSFAADYLGQVQTLIGPQSVRLWLVVAGAILIAFSLGLLRPMKKDTGKTAQILVVILFLTLSLTAGWQLLPRADAFKSARVICEGINQKTGETVEVGIYAELFAGAYNYYLGRNHIPVIMSIEALESFLSKPEPTVVIIKGDHLAQIEARLNMAFEILHEGDVGHRHMLVIKRKFCAWQPNLDRCWRREFNKKESLTSCQIHPG